MCGRYRLARKKEILAQFFNFENDVDWSPRFNVAPGRSVAVIRQDATQTIRSCSLMRWGLVPFWAKHAKIGYKMMNARTETVAGKLAFRVPFKSRRCLIPADGFCESAKEGTKKIPSCFAMADDSIIGFAGIWDQWVNPENTVVKTFSIITTSANPLVAGIHEPMPVILERGNYDVWLDPKFRNLEDLLGLLKPYEAKSMRQWGVNPQMNSGGFDDPICAEECGGI
jgi:putative SOS response-associated peptidase YedK